MKRYPISSLLVPDKPGVGTVVIECFDPLRHTPIKVDLPGNVKVVRPREEALHEGAQRTRVFATYAEREAAVPDHAGQLGLQLSTGTLYISDSTDAGDWTPWAIPMPR